MKRTKNINILVDIQKKDKTINSNIKKNIDKYVQYSCLFKLQRNF